MTDISQAEHRAMMHKVSQQVAKAIDDFARSAAPRMTPLDVAGVFLIAAATIAKAAAGPGVAAQMLEKLAGDLARDAAKAN